jgi:Ca2+-transporting ATPase
MVVGIAVVVGTTLPVLPLQILLLNLVTDVFPALALGVGSGTAGLMSRPPRSSSEGIMTRQHWAEVGAFGVVITAAVLGAMVAADSLLGYAAERAVTVSFLTLAFAQLLHVFNMRDVDSSFFSNEVFRNRFVWGALVLCTGVMLAVVYFPPLAGVLHVVAPDVRGWLLVAIASSLPLLVGQFSLAVRGRRGRSRQVQSRAG